MAYVPVPKDLSKVKTKVAFNLTKRQIVCFAAALLFGLPLFFLLKDSTGTSLASMAMIAVMLPCFLFAMYEKHGQPLEVVVKNIIQTKFIAPKERPYRTDNFYSVLERQRKLEKEVSAIVKRTNKKDAQSLTRPASSPAPRKSRLRKSSDRQRATGKRTPRSRQSLISRCTRTVSARLRDGNTQRPSPLKILTISLHRQTTRPPFLRTGATSSTTLTRA